MHKRNWILLISITVFVGLILLAIQLQSELCLYAASGIPILIFYVLPDIRQNQFVRTSQDRNKFKLFQQSNGEDSFVILSFEPDFIRWECSKLYFHLDDIASKAPASLSPSGKIEASLSVLSFDLVPHRKKSGWVGIRLDQLSQRMNKLSYTTEEVTRLVIQTKDLEAAVIQMIAASRPAAVKNKNKSISA